MVANGEVGAVTSHPVTIPQFEEMVDKTKQPNFELWPAPHPQLVKGVDCPYRHNHLGVNINRVLITASCEYPVEAVKFIDFLYSQEGIDLCTWGYREGEAFIFNADGTRSFGPLITNNPDGMTLQNARHKYTLDGLQMQWNWEYEQQQYNHEDQQASTWGVWTSSSTAANYIPEVVTMTAEESEIYTSVMAQVEPYAQEYILKFIMGIESLDKFESFVSTIKSMGIERAEQARNAAYERYKLR